MQALSPFHTIQQQTMALIKMLAASALLDRHSHSNLKYILIGPAGTKWN